MPDASFSDDLSFTEGLFNEVAGFVPIFGSIDGANRYFSSQIHGYPWELAPEDRKIKALISATKAIDQLRFAGVRTIDTQPLEFPRNGATDSPQAVQEATYEEALSLLQGIDPETEYANTFVTSRVFGKVRTDYDFRTTPLNLVSGIVSRRAWQLLRPYLVDALSIQLRRRS